MRVLKCLVFCSCLLFASCLSEKKAARIKSAAVNDFVNTHPCNNDSTFVAAGSDTAIVYDTVYVEDEKYDGSLDFTYDNIGMTSASMFQLDNKGVIITPQKQIKYITKTVKIKDTLKIVTVDTRMIKILTDSLHAKNEIISDTQMSASEWKSKARTRLWILIAIAALIIGFTGFRLWAKIKSGGIKGLSI